MRAMTTVFTQIIKGEKPARFEWRDDRCVAFLSAWPLRPGHTLLVPIVEVDHWVDLEPAIAQHLMSVAQVLGRALQVAFKPKRSVSNRGPRCTTVHIHLVPIETVRDLDYDRQTTDPVDEDLDAALGRISRALRAAGYPLPT